jgi:hypothetical protein
MALGKLGARIESPLKVAQMIELPLSHSPVLNPVV